MGNDNTHDKQVETGRNPDGTFKKGFSGNPEGRPRKGMAWSDVVIDVGEDVLPSGMTKKEFIVQKVYELARKGEVKAIKLLWDSLVGNRNISEVYGKVEHTLSYKDALKLINERDTVSQPQESS